MDRTPDLLARLLDPAQYKDALEWLRKNAGIPANTIVMPYPEALKTCTSAIRELHARLATAKAEGAAEALDEAAQYFYDEGLPGSLALKDRAAAIRKAAAKEAK